MIPAHALLRVISGILVCWSVAGYELEIAEPSAEEGQGSRGSSPSCKWQSSWDKNEQKTVWTCARCGRTRVRIGEMDPRKSGWGFGA